MPGELVPSPPVTAVLDMLAVTAQGSRVSLEHRLDWFVRQDSSPSSVSLMRSAPLPDRIVHART